MDLWDEVLMKPAGRATKRDRLVLPVPFLQLMLYLPSKDWLEKITSAALPLKGQLSLRNPPFSLLRRARWAGVQGLPYPVHR